MWMGLYSPDTGQLLMAGFDNCGLTFVSYFFTALVIIIYLTLQLGANHNESYGKDFRVYQLFQLSPKFFK
jgi:hypothetical protein